ncbi:MAG TPA: tetratricopeptide repeat protein [Pyrinomonadaceae bacterium]|nr:tetratricopeptide repeat protein [Pyrinomonadaceae bacterium]
MNQKNTQKNVFIIFRSFILVLCFCWLTLAQSSQNSSSTAEDFNKLGMTDLSAGKTNQSIENFSRAIDLKSDYADAYENRCIAYRRLKDFQAALKDCNQAVALNPKSSFSLLLRGMIFFAVGDDQNAVRDFSTAIFLADDYSDAYYFRAIIYKDHKKFDLAISDLTRIIDLNFKNLSPNFKKEEIFYQRGSSNFLLEKDDLALRDLTEALKINPSLSEAITLRGNIYLLKKQYNLAIKDLTAVIKLEPNADFAYYRRGLAYGLKAQFNLALADFNRAIQINPAVKDYYEARAIIYRALGKYSLANSDERKSQILDIP